MSEDEIRDLIADIIVDVAPEIDLSEATGDENLQHRFGLDSMDALMILEEIAEQTGIEIPETDYDQVESLDGLTAYVAQRV